MCFLKKILLTSQRRENIWGFSVRYIKDKLTAHKAILLLVRN